MKQPSGLDASILALESPTQTDPLASRAIYDIPDGAEDSTVPALLHLRHAAAEGLEH